jgi:hypothetical protein
MIQEMVDQVFSFDELGMQEVETSTYLTGRPTNLMAAGVTNAGLGGSMTCSRTERSALRVTPLMERTDG